MIPSKEDRAARALDYFHQGYNCSQSVFAAFADVCGLTEETALKLSSPLGAGIGRMREVCGAFCGMSMLAGSLYGNSSPETGEKEKIFSLVPIPGRLLQTGIRHSLLPGTAGAVSGEPGSGNGAPRRKDCRLLRLSPL